ncbi:MAG: hypothetical protein ACYTG0_38430, partial [Planctomycetota bacterium]
NGSPGINCPRIWASAKLVENDRAARTASGKMKRVTELIMGKTISAKNVCLDRAVRRPLAYCPRDRF